MRRRDSKRIANLEAQILQLGVKNSDLSVRISKACNLVWDYGYVEGEHHKQWLIDRMLRELMTHDEYRQWVKNYNEPEEDENGDEIALEWSEGTAP